MIKGKPGVLALEKPLNLIIAHLKAAFTAVVRWWFTMSDAEKRLTQKRAVSVVACVAVFAMAGPFIAQRFDVQKTEEAYRADAYQLAQSLGAGGAETVQHVSFTNKASPTALFQSVSFALSQTSDVGLKAVPLRERDTMVLASLTGFTAQNLGAASHEQSEADCLAEAIYYEARSENVKGQMAVAEVVMNRVKDPRFPKTVCAVVYQGRYRDTGCQFTFTCDGSLNNPPQGESWDRARAIALHVVMGLNTPITNKATHYHTDYVNPYWKAGLVETAEIGTHIFYRFPKTGQEWSDARIALAAQNGESSDDQPIVVPVDLPADAGIAISPPVNDADKLAAAQLLKISVTQKPQPVVEPIAAAAPAGAAPDARAL